MTQHQDDQSFKSAWSRSIPVKEQFKIIFRMMGFAKPYRWTFLIAIIATAAVSVINILLPQLLQNFMDNYLDKGNGTWGIVVTVALWYGFGVLVKAIVQFFGSFLYMMSSERTLEDFRRALFEKLHRLGMRYFDLTPAGSIVSRVTNDTWTIADFLNVFNAILVGSFAIITAFIAMYTTNATAAWIVLLFLPVMLVAIYFYAHYSSRVYRHMREKLSELNAKINESVEGMGVIQSFRQEQRIAHEFESTNKEYLQSRKSMIKTNSLLLSPIVNLLYTLSLTAALAHFGILAQHDFVAGGVIYAFTTYVSNFFNPMSNMMDSLSSLQDGIVAGSRIFKILDDTTYEPAQLPDASGTIEQGKIEFKHVSFSYDGEHQVLNDVSFVINPGETLGIVGHTGSGKSSIINVMMRFYEYGAGEVLLDGRNIRSYPKAELRQKIGLVLQDSFMFYGDISSNIRLFNQHITDQEIQEAAEFVQADRFIHDLPGGYHAKVIEGGTQFSSGQRQLISFARTIVANPKILILDEATANIDTETETLIQEGLKRMRKGRTTIAIAHRLSTIRDANKIIVLDAGSIVEAGTHEELLAQKGSYYQLYRLQRGLHSDS